MTNPDPPKAPPFELGYITQENQPAKNALRLAATLLRILAGFLSLQFTVTVAMLVIIGLARDLAPINSVMIGVQLVVDSLAAVLHLFAAGRLAKLGRNARGWGLASAIVACCQINCGVGWLLSLGIGIYLLIFLFRKDVRELLRNGSAPGFEVDLIRPR